MSSSKSLRDAILPYLSRNGDFISASGIRYGSVLYIAFGEGIFQPHHGRTSTTQYPVELEVGSDTWILTNGSDQVLDSGFDDTETARNTLHNILVGRKVQDLETTKTESKITFDNNLVLRSYIVPEPAAGFLYSFHVENGPVWETIDGIAMEV
jgi:hypothetical protein